MRDGSSCRRCRSRLIRQPLSLTIPAIVPSGAARSGGEPVVMPPQGYFAISAVFHYLGPAFAVLLFARVDVLGVAWLRIAAAAAVFALWRRPWRALRRLDGGGRRLLLAWGTVLAAMNCCFYVAIDRLPLGTVAAIEFLPVIVLAALGARTARNVAALLLAVPGVYLLTDVRLEGEPLGVALAFANAVLFALYIVLGHRVAQRGAGDRRPGAVDAGRGGRRHARGGLGRGARAARPGRAAGGRRGRHLVVGHPLRLRPARDGAAHARGLRADGLAAPGDRDGDRDRRARPGAGACRRSPEWRWSWPAWRCIGSLPARAPARDPSASPGPPPVAATGRAL